MTNEIQTKDELRQQRRNEMAQASFAKNAQGGAMMVPTNGRELMDMAQLVSQSNQMVAPMYRNNPGDCAALIMLCSPYGLNPFTVSWKTYKASKNGDAPIGAEPVRHIRTSSSGFCQVGRNW